ncbi:tetratricopeptide repeat protein [Mesorhizobium sp. NBSH29]|uniref:tetratricopeptide repeat protein n=1 Tax=Mesorhizobium sp. NBSH29 TaxID=2654249 RepID=UPI00215632DB|nr:hypothetical protein [Mesorhizobium sp. NBSH29]
MFIQYLVDREQAGEADRLKGYSIAVDVFGKDEEFDPATDSVVRVQAGRLRDLLSHYYASEGAAEKIRISVPRGSYVPEYEIRTLPQTESNLEPIKFSEERGGIGLVGIVGGHPVALQATRGARLPEIQILTQLRMIWFAVSMVVVALGFILYQAAPPATSEIVTAATGKPARALAAIDRIAIETLPTVFVRVTHPDQETRRVELVLRRGLSGFDTVAFIASPPVDEFSSKLNFVFELSDGAESGSVVAELQHEASSKVLLSRTFSAAEIALTLDDQVAAMLSATIPASGILYSHIEQNNLQLGLTNCLLLNDDFYLNQTAEGHLKAYKCFERLIAAGTKSPLVYSEMAALHLKTVTDGYFYPRDATAEQAMELARNSVLMGPTSPYSHRAYGFINSRAGTAEESMRWMKKAYELNTFDLSMAAAYANSLVFSGAYAEGVALMKRAVDLTSAHAPWWDYGLFLGQYMLDDLRGAAQAADGLMTIKRSPYLAARLVVAYNASDFVTCRYLARQLEALDPGFSADPQGYFLKANYPPALADRFTRSLRIAGLGGNS